MNFYNFFRQSGQATTPSQLLEVLHENDVLRQCFSRINQIVQLMNIVPTSTAAVERGFSTMNLLCTPLRSCLTHSSLRGLMTINIEGPQDLRDQKYLMNFMKSLD